MRYALAAAEASRTLEAAGFPETDSRRDTAVLARAILGWDTAAWLAHIQDDAPDEFLARLHAAVARRARREPVAYITGEREFYGRTFRVTRDVLIPRPETELVIDEARACLDQPDHTDDGSPRIVDIGTGSGCLAITLALEYPRARVIATDISAEALLIATENAARLQAAARVTFQHTALSGGLSNATDLIVSNPPYVALLDRATLAPDVRDYEPESALFGGPDGLDVVRALLPDAERALRPGGWLVMEIGAGQSAEVERLLSGARELVHERTRADLSGIPRVVVARKRRRSV